MSEELRRVDARFADDNPLLWLTLGALSSLERLLEAVKDHSAPVDSARGGDIVPPDVAPDAIDEQGIELVLGLLAIRATILERIAEEASELPSEPFGDAAPNPSRQAGSFLR